MNLFLSYSREDEAFVERLRDDLVARGIEIWRDREEMFPGDFLSQEILTGIAEATVFLIVVSPGSMSSDWCNWELDHACKLEEERKSKFVVPILYKGELPESLDDKFYADFRSDYSSGLTELLEALHLVEYRKETARCPHCGNVEVYEIRVPKLGPIEEKVIDCSQCNQQYYLQLRRDSSKSYTRTPNGDYDVQELDLVDATQYTLKRCGAWVIPKQLRGILKLMKETETELKKDAAQASPSQLQAAMLNSKNVALYGVSRQRIREFITVLMQSRYFDFRRSDFKGVWRHTAYTNSFDEQRVVDCYLRGCFYKLREAKVIQNLQEALSVSEFLLEDLQVDVKEIGRRVWEGMESFAS